MTLRFPLSRRHRLAPWMAGVLCAAMISGAPAASSAAESTPDPLRVLLLGYHDPHEHDVLQSFLCVDPCAGDPGCPADLPQKDVAWFSEDFVVWRPVPGESAVELIDEWKGRSVDFLSFSGHHASGFTGERDRGRFDTEQVGEDLLEAEIVGADDFFTSPALVLLQGCRTDVSHRFDGDPLEYVLHVIEDTQVRGHEFDRLLAAVQQVGGVQQAYRDLFPNACLLGYRGSQAPGGLVEIFGQIDRWLRGLAASLEGVEPTPPTISLDGVWRSRAASAEAARRIEAECPGGWPCNLCKTRPEVYRPLADALATWLRVERRRIHVHRKAPFAPTVRRTEAAWDEASYYANTAWACPVTGPGRAPVYPEPVDESPFAGLFLDLLLLDPLPWSPDQHLRLQKELFHRLGWIELTAEDRGEIQRRLQSDETWPWIRERILSPAERLSTFRQRDLFAFLAEADCDRCFREILGPDDRARSPVVRENAAARLGPDLDPAVWIAAFDDPEVRVRREAAGQLTFGVPFAAWQRATRQDDPETRRLAKARREALLREPPDVGPESLSPRSSSAPADGTPREPE